MFYHRLLLNTVKSAKFRRKLRLKALGLAEIQLPPTFLRCAMASFNSHVRPPLRQATPFGIPYASSPVSRESCATSLPRTCPSILPCEYLSVARSVRHSAFGGSGRSDTG